MLNSLRKHWLGGAAALAVSAAALGALTIPTSSAQAQEWFGLQLGPFGFGVGAAPYYYYNPYYNPYYHYYYPYGYHWGYPY
ncbi:MAG TPA: hypothetical protein VJ770_19650 [Stellaceae bacterium]|nr:hypothetical protein [Stellaceae bacterium]